MVEVLAPTHDFVAIKSPAWVAVVEQGSVALHQGDEELLEEVEHSGGLLLSSVSGERAAQLLDLSYGCLMPAAKALHSKRQEDDALIVARLPRFVQLALMGNLEGMYYILGTTIMRDTKEK